MSRSSRHVHDRVMVPSLLRRYPSDRPTPDRVTAHLDHHMLALAAQLAHISSKDCSRSKLTLLLLLAALLNFLESQFGPDDFANLDQWSPPLCAKQTLLRGHPVVTHGELGDQECGVLDDPLHDRGIILDGGVGARLQAQLQHTDLLPHVLDRFLACPIALWVVRRRVPWN